MNSFKIKLTSFDVALIDKVTKLLTKTALETGSKVNGPIPLKTILNKKHVRSLEIIDVKPKTIDALLKLDIPKSVHVNIKQS